MKTKTGVIHFERSIYGLDIEEQLTNMLSEQIAREIEIGILRGFGIEPDRNKRRKNSINKILKSFE